MLRYAAEALCLCQCPRKHSMPPYGRMLLQDELYKFPDVYVCLYNFYGCDAQDQEEDCLYSALEVEGRNSSAEYYKTFFDNQTLDVFPLDQDRVLEVSSKGRGTDDYTLHARSNDVAVEAVLYQGPFLLSPFALLRTLSLQTAAVLTEYSDTIDRRVT